MRFIRQRSSGALPVERRCARVAGGAIRRARLWCNSWCIEAMPKVRVTPIDKRILEPGWAGEPEPAELEFLIERLAKDRRLAVRWGFDPVTTKHPEWAILQVAMWGDPKQQALNTALTRQQLDRLNGVQVPLF